MIIGVLVALLIAAVVVSTVTLNHETHLSNQAHERDRVAQAASALADAILSYNATNLSQSRAKVAALATQDFLNNYDQNFTKALSGSIVALKATATATVRAVYVANVTATSAMAIVVVDFDTKSTSGSRSVVGTHLEMELVRQGGQWKVNTVSLLSVSSENQTPVFGTPTTTTPKKAP
jgi:Mce-associated membrane protein